MRKRVDPAQVDALASTAQASASKSEAEAVILAVEPLLRVWIGRWRRRGYEQDLEQIARIQVWLAIPDWNPKLSSFCSFVGKRVKAAVIRAARMETIGGWGGCSRWVSQQADKEIVRPLSIEGNVEATSQIGFIADTSISDPNVDLDRKVVVEAAIKFLDDSQPKKWRKVVDAQGRIGKKLGIREASVIRQLYLEDLSSDQVAKKMGITGQRIRQVEKAAMTRLVKWGADLV